MATIIETGFAHPGQARAVRPSLSVRVADTLIEWLRRGRSRHMLAQMDDRMLHDIGLSRDAALSEVDKPFWRA